LNNLDQQIAVSASTDGGATFSTPVVINDNSLFGRDRALFADPSVGPDGELYVSWHDFDNQARIMVDRSFDGGVTWGSDVLVSPFALGLKHADTAPTGPRSRGGSGDGRGHQPRAAPRARLLAYCHAGAFGIDVSLRYSDDQRPRGPSRFASVTIRRCAASFSPGSTSVATTAPSVWCSTTHAKIRSIRLPKCTAR
jgi:hypothetical protein